MRLSACMLLSSLTLFGCGAGENGLAGGSSDQGNALHLTLSNSGGSPATGIVIEIHPRTWIRGSSVDPDAQTLRTDSLGSVVIPFPTGKRLVASQDSLGTWADLDSLHPSHDTLRLERTARITGMVTGAGAGSYLAIPGTGLSASLDDSGRFSLTVPAGLGTLSLIDRSRTINLPPVPASSGSTTTLAPLPASAAADAPLLGLSSQWQPMQLTLRSAWLGRLGDTSFLRIAPGAWATFGSVIPDSAPEGTVRFLFRPAAQFDRDSAWTLIGDQGGRMHIGYLRGLLFFQKGQDNMHHFVTSRLGQLQANRWYSIQATWGPLGMVLSVDGTPVAWSSDSSSYQRDARSDTSDLISIGHKDYCCMDALRITRPMQGAGDYSDIQFLKTQADAWNDGKAHACPDSVGGDILARCGIRPAVHVTSPLW